MVEGKKTARKKKRMKFLDFGRKKIYTQNKTDSQNKEKQVSKFQQKLFASEFS